MTHLVLEMSSFEISKQTFFEIGKVLGILSYLVMSSAAASTMLSSISLCLSRDLSMVWHIKDWSTVLKVYIKVHQLSQTCPRQGTSFLLSPGVIIWFRLPYNWIEINKAMVIDTYVKIISLVLKQTNICQKLSGNTSIHKHVPHYNGLGVKGKGDHL